MYQRPQMGWGCLWSKEVRRNEKNLPGKNLFGSDKRTNIMNNLELEQGPERETEDSDDITPPALEGKEIEPPAATHNQRDE